MTIGTNVGSTPMPLSLRVLSAVLRRLFSQCPLGLSLSGVFAMTYSHSNRRLQAMYHLTVSLSLYGTLHYYPSVLS